MNGNRAPYPDRNIVSLESEYLAETSHIHPCFACNLCVLLRIFFFFQIFYGICAFPQAFKSIDTLIVRLNKNRLSHVQQAVADFSLDADI